MKLSDFLKQYEGLDPNTEVDSTGKVLSSYDAAYNLGFNAKSKKDNPYSQSLLECLMKDLTIVRLLKKRILNKREYNYVNS